MRKRALITIDLGSSTYKRYSSEGLEYPTASPVYYEGRIITMGDISRALSEMYFGSQSLSNVSFTLDDTDGAIRKLGDNYELRNCEVTAQWVDLDAQIELDTATLIITGVDLPPGKATFSCVQENLDVWKTNLPKNKITEDIFATGTIPDDYKGKPISTWFGAVKDVPLHCIQEDRANDYYDYLSGYGTLNGVDAVYREAGGERRVTVSASDYTVYDGSQGSPFPGYAFIRFIVPQRDSSDNLHNIWADVQGVTLSGSNYKNPVLVLQALISNSIWGLGLSVNSTSFANAAMLLNSANDYVGGGFWDFKSANEWKNYLLLSCRLGQLSNGSSGYEIYIPEYTAIDSATFDDYNIIIEGDRKRNTTEYVKKIKLNYNYKLKNGNYSGQKEASTGKSFGVEKEYFAPFTTSDIGATTITTLLKNRFLYQDRMIDGVAGQDAAQLSIHDIVNVSHSKQGLSAQRFEILSMAIRAKDYKMTLGEYSSLVFSG